MVGIIAGTGSLPVAACQTLRAQDKPFCVISLFPEDNGTALHHAAGNAPVIEQKFYRASSILNELIKLNVTSVLMIGKVNKQLLINNIKLDWLAVKLLASVAYKNDQEILQRIVDEFKKHNISVLHQNEVLPSLITKPGLISGSINEELHSQIIFGMQIAKKISMLDIGQTVVVKNNMILAIEAIEGTDNCIKRGINLGGTGVIVCKAAQAAHNTQFDLPTLGSATLKNIIAGEIQAIAWLASHTLIVDYDNFLAEAQARHITLLAV